MDSITSDNSVARRPFRAQHDSSEKTDSNAIVSEYEVVDSHNLKSWHGGPVYPENLEWQEGGVQSASSRLLKSGITNLILILFPIAYLALACGVAYLNGRVVHDINLSNELALNTGGIPDLMKQAIKYSITLWGIGISLIFGRVLNSIANYKVQKGTRLLALEQLVSAKTFSSAFLAPVKLKTVNKSTIAIAALWALSPIISQALLRVFTIGTTLIGPYSPHIHYVDLTAAAPLLTDWNRYDQQIFTASQLFTSTLFVPAEDIEHNPVDTWKNPRIPSLDSLKELYVDKDGWYQTTMPKKNKFIDKASHNHTSSSHTPTKSSTSGTSPTHGTPSSTRAVANINPNVQYSSLFGLPIDGIKRNSTHFGVVTDFNVETAYFSVQDCSDYHSVSVFELLKRYPYDSSPSKTAGNWSWTSCSLQDHVCSKAEDLGSLYVNLKVDAGKRYLTFASQYQGHGQPKLYEYSTCELISNFVESGVRCLGDDCAVVKMRRGHPRPFPKVDSHGQDHPWEQGLVAGFVQSTMPRAEYMHTNKYLGHGVITLLEKWIHGQDLTLKDTMVYKRLKGNVPLDEFTRKLSILVDSFYHATLEPIYQTAGPVLNFPQSSVTPPKTLPFVGTMYHQVPSYVCHWPFFGLIVAACAIVICLLIFATILDTKVVGPDVMGCISSMTYANAYIPLPPGGSALTGVERTRKLGDLMVRLQDVHPDKPVGEVAISTLDGQPLQRGRKYL